MSDDKERQVAKTRLAGLLRKKKKGMHVPEMELSKAYKAAGVKEPKKEKPKKKSEPKKEEKKEEKKDD